MTAPRTTTPQQFQLLIKPVSAACNQRCEYCFYRRVERMYPAPRRMSGEVLERVVRRYLGMSLEQSLFCWQGGEPTLAGLDFYERAVQLMRAHGRGGQAVANALQTNGLLLDDAWCKFLAQYQFLVGLSLDGPPDLHNAFRKKSGGEGTHAEVLRAMRLLSEHGVEFNVLVVVNSLTVRHARRVYQYFRELGLRYLQFIPCVETAPNGSPAPFSVTPEAYGEFLCELFDLWRPEASSGVSERLFDALQARELTGRSGLCILDGACGGYCVVEHNGDVYPCDFFVEEAWRLGNVTTMTFPELQARGRARRFRAARHRLPAACEGCDWLDLCRGGCLKDRLRSGGLDAPSFLCAAWQRFFAHAAAPIRELTAQVRAATKPG